MKYLGFKLTYCPECGKEVIEIGYNEELKILEKECPDCDLFFIKLRGYGRRWKMGKFEEVY